MPYFSMVAFVTQSFNDKSLTLMKGAGKPGGLVSGHDPALAAAKP